MSLIASIVKELFSPGVLEESVTNFAIKKEVTNFDKDFRGYKLKQLK